LGFTKEETEDALIELNYLGVENVLLVRGDSPNYEKQFSKQKTFNNYAVDLVRQVSELREGKFLEDLADSSKIDFCIGVAGYPEKHFESANHDLDIHYLKEKVNAGANYIVTQMFFDNSKFIKFVERCRAADIHIPIVPGLKILKSINQIKTIPRTFHVDLPGQLVNEMLESPENSEEIGMRWAKKQVEELLNHKHNHLHFYVMNDAHLVRRVIESIQ
jgi:methylenetetrahydrofolate reductase (NADPH)